MMLTIFIVLLYGILCAVLWKLWWGLKIPEEKRPESKPEFDKDSGPG